MINLKAVRTEKGLTQEQLAEQAGVVRQTISNIECGLSLPSIATAQAIAKILEFDWSKFFHE